MTDVTPAPGDRLRAALSGASTVAPDEAARAQNRARQAGAPRTALVGLPQDQWPSSQQNFDVEGFLRDYPRTSRYLETPANAQVAGDPRSRQQLGQLERQITRSGFVARPGDTLQPLRRPNTPGQWLRGLGAALTSGEAWEGAQLQLGDALGLWRNPSERAAAVRDYESATARVEMARPEVNGVIGQGIYGGLESTARMVPATALSVLLRNPAPLLATAGATTETAAYGKYSARGATGTEATIGAAGEGAVEVLTELIPMGAFVRALGEPTAKRFITEIGASVLSDAAGEQVATLAQDAIDTAIANPDKTWGEYLAERPDAATQTLVSSLTQSLLMSGSAAGVRATGQFIDSRMQQAAEVETDASTITNLVEGARAADLRGRSSESFAEFVAQASEGGPVENLYVAAEALNQSGVDIAALRAAVPAIDQQIEQATKDGGDIQIPVEQFAANAVEIDGVDGLVDHLRINPALPSRAEVSALAQEQTGEVQAEAARIIADATTQDAFRQSAERVETGMFEQLQTAGRFSRDVNRSYASLVGSFYTVQAQRLGITPEQMAERYPLRIAAELPQATRAETLDQVEQDRIQLVHYSRSPGLVESDPTRWGSNRATPQSERNRTANAPGRTYFYDRAARPTPETSIAKTAPFRYGASVLRSALYDFDTDPQGLRPVEGVDTASAYENAIRDAGFAGYFSNAVVEGAIAVFDPMPLRAEGLVQTVQQAQAVERKQIELQQAERRARQAGNPEIVASKPLADFRNEALREVFPDAALLAPIEGAPKSVKVDGERIKIEPFPPAREAAAAYMASQGLRYEPPRAYAAVDTGRATRLAEAFDGMAHAPNDPVVRAAYNAMIEETLAQYQFVKATGLEIEFIQGADPYAASPRLATKDVVENNHLWVFPTDDGFGGTASAGVDISGNPLLAPVNEWIGDRQLLANDVFRIVHDYFGHVKDGFGFRADGEENAWQSHAAMYSPLARRAMTTETRGQNSWVNYGPFGAFNKTANAGETQYAPQKIGLLPSWADTDGFLGGEQSGTAAGVLAQGPVLKTGTAEFKAWFGDSKVVDESGQPLVVYHGTTSEFDAFNRSRANPESDLGAGFYFSNTTEDVANNYAGEGPDLTNKLERLAERVRDEFDQDGREDASEDEVYDEARSRLAVQNGGTTLPVYLSIQNPVVIGGENETRLDYEEAYDEEADEYGEPTGKLVEFAAAIREELEAEDSFEGDADKAVSDLLEYADGGITATQAISRLKESEGLMYATDENGDRVSNEIIRRGFAALGFDGYIDHTVDQKFGSQKRTGKAMEGMSEETVHYVAFRPEQIKSVFNRGTFDANDPRILYQAEEVRPHPAFYSALSRAVAKASTTKASPSQWLATLRKTPGVKAEEIEWSGLEEWLALATTDEFAQVPSGMDSVPLADSKGNVTREAVLTFLENGGVQVEEVVLGELGGAREAGIQRMLRDMASEGWDRAQAEEEWDNDPGQRFEADGLRTQFDQYKLPGADETYRELLLTLPRIDGPSTHWDQQNVVAHVRLTSRQDASGAKVLFLEEVQSDWHQKGRDEGYQSDVSAERLSAMRDAEETAITEVNGAREALADAIAENLTAQADALDAAILDYTKNPLAPALPEGISQQAGRLRGHIRFLENGGDPTRILGDQTVPVSTSTPEIAPVYRAFSDARLRMVEARSALSQLEYGIPNAPFQKSWPQLAMKRMISYAVENGFDKVAWINGNQQNGGQTGGDGSFFYERNLVNLTNEIIKKVGGKVEPVDMMQIEVERQKVAGARSLMAEPGADVERYQRVIDGVTRQENRLGIQNGFVITEQMKAQAAEGFALFQRNRGQIAFGTDITQTPSVISLLQTADLSTFLHETGHFFLEVTRDMASRPDAPAEIKADMDTLLGWFGVSDLDTWSKMGWEEKRRYHEQFARGFEAYLFEGRAPTPRLRELFQRFRSWLLNVYRSLTQLNVELTDDVRDVLGRMVAAEDEITAATSGYGLTPLAEKPPYMDDASWADYQAAFANAEQEGVDTLTTRSVRDMKWLSNARSRALRRLQSEARQQRQQVKAEVTAEVMAEPVNRARAYIRRGVGPDGEVVPGAVKLDRAALEQMFGTADDAVWRSLRTGGKYGEVQADGVHPDVAAEMFGYDSGDALVRDMASAEDANEKIAGMTDQRMLERYGEMADQAALERAADEAIANDAHARAIATDYAALAAATGQPRALAAAAREHAASIINRIELRRLKPHQFFAAMTRAGKAADKAARSGDLAKAAQYRRAQLINLQAAKYALEAKAEVDKALTRFTRIVSANDEGLARSRDMALVNASRAILSAYGIGRVKNAPASYLKLVNTYDPQLYADIQPFVEGATGTPKPIDQISYEQFQGLRDTVNQLWVLSLRTRQIELDGVLVGIDTARDALGARLDEIGYSTPVGQEQRQTEVQEFQRNLQGARAALRRVESWVRAVDAADFGPFRTFIWNVVSSGADRYRIAQGEYLRRFLDLVKPIEASLTNAKIGAAEIGYTFTGKAELLHAVLHSGNTSNLSKLLLGRRWGKQTEDGALDTTRWDAFLERAWAEGILTQADYDFAQGVWDLMDATKPAAQAAHRAMYGRYFSEVTAQPITTPWGEYRGGYVPATTDSFMVRDAQLREEQNALEDSNAFMFPAASNGFTKSRVEDYTRELSLDIRLLPMHIDKVLKFTHLGPPVRDVARVLRGRAFAEKLDAFDPVAASDLLLPWLQRSARQVVQEPSKGRGGKLVDGFFRELRSRTGMQIMFANLSNVLQQVTSFSNAAVRVKPSHIGKGLWAYVRDPKGTTEAVTGLSDFMATRTTSQVFEMRQTIEQLLLNPSKYEKLRDFSQRHAYFAQFALQNITDLSVWRAAYNQSLERGDSDRDAVRFADSVIRETQGSMAPEDIARFETGTSFQRAFTQFYSYFNNQANLLGTGFMEVARTTGVKKGGGQLFYLYVTGFAIPALLAQALADLAKGGWDDDEDDGYLDEFLNWFFGSQLKFTLAGVPVVGPIANAALGGFTPQSYDDRVSISPAISLIESAAALPAAYVKATQDGEPVGRKEVRDTMTLLGLLTGLPIGAAGRPVAYGYGVATGEIEPTSALDAARGAVTGAPSKESLGR